jgi:hypothetical protein
MKSRDSKGIHRREFLQVSSAAVIGLAVGGLLPREAAADTRLLPLLSLGYAGQLPLDGRASALAAAGSQLLGDPTFISRGARITVHGAGRSAKQLRDSISLNAVFPVFSRSREQFPRFNSFSYSDRWDGGAYVAGKIAYNMPVTADGVQFLLTREDPDRAIPKSDKPSEPSSLRSPITLSLGSSSGAPKLKSGVYAFAIREDKSDAEPNWDRLNLVNKDGVYSVADASFSYILVEIGQNRAA